jgi:multiple sugar transport system ATP-binding protein
MNFIDATVVEEANKMYVTFEGEKIPLSEATTKILKEKGYAGKEVIMGIRPEQLDDDPEFIAKHTDAIISATVEVTELMGSETFLYLKKGKATFTAKVDGTSKAKIDDSIKIALNPDMIHIFDKESELTIV